MRAQISTCVPAAYVPAWRDVPCLAWVAARAYVPGWLRGRIVPGMAASCSMLVWLPSVICMRAGRRVAALDRCALVTIEPAGRRGLIELAWPVLAATASLVGVIGALTAVAIGAAIFALWAGVGEVGATAAGVAVVAIPVLVASLMLAPWRVIGARPRIAATIHALQAEAPNATIWRMGALAAWPTGRGHGSALVKGLLRDWQGGGFAVGYARDPDVEGWYRQLGMREYPAGGALSLDLR